jgi:hypothetical protein
MPVAGALCARETGRNRQRPGPQCHGMLLTGTLIGFPSGSQYLERPWQAKAVA